jgi:hypothetical protein
MPNASLDQTLGSVTLDAQALNTNNLSVDQTLQSVALTATGILGRVLTVKDYLGEAKLDAQIALGDKPAVITGPPRIYNLTGPVRDSGGAILCFVGPPWKTVEWRMVQGTGTLTPFTTFTDARGQASCRFDAGYHPKKTLVVVGVAYVP